MSSCRNFLKEKQLDDISVSGENIINNKQRWKCQMGNSDIFVSFMKLKYLQASVLSGFWFIRVKVFFLIIFKPELKWDHHLHRALILTCDKDRNEYVKYSQITKVSGLNFWTICKIFYVIFFPGYFCIWIAPVGLQKRTGSLSPVKNVRNLEMSNML